LIKWTRKQTPTLQRVIDSVKQGIQKNFDLQAFRKILYLTPHFFEYYWQQASRGPELVVDIPQDIEQRVSDDAFKSPRPRFYPSSDGSQLYEKCMSRSLMDSRVKQFSQRLYERLYQQHKVFLEERIAHNMEDAAFCRELLSQRVPTMLHCEFDAHKESLPLADLKPPPATRNVTSINQFLQEFEVKSQIAQGAMGLHAVEDSDDKALFLEECPSESLSQSTAANTIKSDRFASSGLSQETLTQVRFSELQRQQKKAYKEEQLAKSEIQKNKDIQKEIVIAIGHAF